MQISGVTIGFPMPVSLLAKPVRAGFPSPADDFIEEEIDLQRLLIVTKDGGVPAAQALDWLKQRKQFRPSSWRDQNTFEDLASVDRDEPVEEMLFVPVAADGSTFHPGVAHEGVFTTGPTGREAAWPSFEEALVALQRSPEPVWRRPTPRGLRTQARGVRWDRTTRAALDKMAAEAAARI